MTATIAAAMNSPAASAPANANTAITSTPSRWRIRLAMTHPNAATSPTAPVAAHNTSAAVEAPERLAATPAAIPTHETAKKTETRFTPRCSPAQEAPGRAQRPNEPHAIADTSEHWDRPSGSVCPGVPLA